MSNDTQTRDIAGRYKLREAMAKRPVGRWFRAHDREADAEVGLLLVNPELLPDEGSQNRFIGAVVEMRGINHRHLLKLFDVGREGGSVYLTTQLTQPIRALYKSEGVLDYVNSVADGLDAVHRAGQTHGRLTPSDISEVQGLIKVGGAGLYSEIKPALAMRVWRGLSCFWAPEVIRGERPTPATDVYSLAAIAAVLLNNGQAADPHQALTIIQKENRALYDALAPALAVGPDDRPASPSLLVNRLANAVDDDEVDEQPTTYFVKSDMDDPELLGSDVSTVLDVNVPPAVAAAAAPSTPASPTMNATAAAVRQAVAAKRERMLGRAPGPGQPGGQIGGQPGGQPGGQIGGQPGGPVGKRKSSKNIQSNAHDRTVVEATTIPKDATRPDARKIPAMVSMGPPVGPSQARQRPPSGKTTQKTAIPQSLNASDATERMTAAHGAELEAQKAKAPPVVASQSWAARSNVRPPSGREERKREPSRNEDPSERATTVPRPATPRPGPSMPGATPVVAASTERGSADMRPLPGVASPRPPGAERPEDEARRAAGERARASNSAELAYADTEAAMPSSQASRAARVDDSERATTTRPNSDPGQPSPAHPGGQAHQSGPIPEPSYDDLGHYAPPAGMQEPETSNNLTWLYVVIAAVVSATLAIFAAMALFGN